MRRPFVYLFVDLKPTTKDGCRLRTNVLPGEERFEQGEEQDNVSQALLKYLKQQNLMAPPLIPEMQRLQNNMDNVLYRADLGEYDKARQYMQLQNRFLTYKHQLNSLPQAATTRTQPEEQEQIPTNVLADHLQAMPIPAQEPVVTIPTTSVQTPTVEPAVKETSTPPHPSLPPSILTPPPTVEMSPGPSKKRKRPHIRLLNYLDDEKPSRRSRRLKSYRSSPYKYSKTQEDDD